MPGSTEPSSAGAGAGTAIAAAGTLGDVASGDVSAVTSWATKAGTGTALPATVAGGEGDDGIVLVVSLVPRTFELLALFCR